MRLAVRPIRNFFTSKQASEFRRDGYSLLKGYIDPMMCRQAITRIDQIIRERIAIEPKPNVFEDDFDMKGALVESADKIRLFYEPKGIVNGKFVRPREQSVNKIGHNLHTLEPIFKAITYNDKAIEILKTLGYKKPAVPQSMAILKPPKIGGEVDVHQDSTYLISDPDTLLAFWIPLEKCTTENGCLWGLAQENTPLYKVIEHNQHKQLQTEPDWKKEKLSPIEMDAGDLIIFHGKFIHKSLENLSNKSRYAYTWHLYDFAKSKWPSSNWIPYREFPAYY